MYIQKEGHTNDGKNQNYHSINYFYNHAKLPALFFILLHYDPVYIVPYSTLFFQQILTLLWFRISSVTFFVELSIF